VDDLFDFGNDFSGNAIAMAIGAAIDEAIEKIAEDNAMGFVDLGKNLGSLGSGYANAGEDLYGLAYAQQQAQGAGNAYQNAQNAQYAYVYTGADGILNTQTVTYTTIAAPQLVGWSNVALQFQPPEPVDDNQKPKMEEIMDPPRRAIEVL
jgi:hypothetical protein